MKRLWILVLSAVVVMAILYGVRMAERHSNSGVASLLPRGTVAFADVPDFNAAIDEWHKSDIYQIYLEPAVQEFLKNPKSGPPRPGSASARVDEFQQLKARDAFVALTSITNDQPKLIAGFEYHCPSDVADRVIASWRSFINPSAQREQTEYQKHQIEVFRQSSYSIAMVRDQNWFFASNDLEELKAVLDRADGRIKDREALLTGDPSYKDAMAAMPASFALLTYLQPKAFAERLAAARSSTGARDQNLLLEQIHSVCLATRFDGGKLHDTAFVGIPKQEQSAALTRNSLGMATRATILYAANLVDFSKPAGILFPVGDTNALGPAAKRIGDALAAAGVGAADWQAAFGSELSLLSEWPEQTRWPSFLLSAAVKDGARAKKIVDALTHGTGRDEHWEQGDRNGAHYWSLVSASGWFSIRPVMALSDKVWIAGLDAASVDEAVQRASQPAPGLADTEPYRKAEGLVPMPTKFFAYLDPAQIYSRVDATVRPFLFMSAMFVPAARGVDLTKIPPPEAVTKHLSPIVASQHYAGNGYIAESVGPLTLNQAGIGVAVLGGFGAMAYHKMNPLGVMKGLPLPIPGGRATPASPPAQAPSPTATP
jgi:hypothetical protein